MLVQKYHNIHAIDSEFIPGLEDILENELTSFDELKNWTDNAPENIHFTYYLFFNPVKNSPVGFAMVQMTKVETTEKSFFGIIRKREKDIYLTWSIPGLTGQGIVYNPIFEDEVLSEFKKVRCEFESRARVNHEEVTLQAIDLQDDLKSRGFQVHRGGFVVSPFRKTFSSIDQYFQTKGLNYEDYFLKLKQVMKENKLKVSVHQNFKDIFRNIEAGNDLYLHYRSLPELSVFKKMNSKIICLWRNNELSTLMGFTLGKNNKAFLKVAHIDHLPNQELESSLLFLALDQFYHEDKFQDLLISSKDFSSSIVHGFGLETKETYVAVNSSPTKTVKKSLSA